MWCFFNEFVLFVCLCFCLFVWFFCFVFSHMKFYCFAINILHHKKHYFPKICSHHLKNIYFSHALMKYHTETIFFEKSVIKITIFLYSKFICNKYPLFLKIAHPQGIQGRSQRGEGGLESSNWKPMDPLEPTNKLLHSQGSMESGHFESRLAHLSPLAAPSFWKV